jgi:sulfatase maturation enzyme AslB (radical SAM superfamily)
MTVLFSARPSEAPGAPLSQDVLTDPFGRRIDYLRVSVTDRCDLRCVYCMAERQTFLPRQDLLSLEELDRLCTSFIDLGTRRLRLTGGEPLVRKGFMDLVRSLSRHLQTGRLEELTLTTTARGWRPTPKIWRRTACAGSMCRWIRWIRTSIAGSRGAETWRR